MKVAIIGLGGIGGYIGARLCKAYSADVHQINFVQRGRHLDAIKANGLRYVTKEVSVVHPHKASDRASDIGVCDLVYFSVKSRDLLQAAKDNAALIGNNTVLMTSLNGVHNAERLQTVYPQNRILNGCIYVSAHITQPGEVKQVGGVGNLYFGPEQGAIDEFRVFETLFVEAGIKAVLSPNIKEEVWKKYVFISSWASVSSCYDVSVGQILASSQMLNEWLGLIGEIEQLARKKGVVLPANTVESCVERAKLIPFENKTSMQLDIEKHTKPELDVFTEYVIEQSALVGLDAAMHKKMYEGILARLNAAGI